MIHDWTHFCFSICILFAMDFLFLIFAGGTLALNGRKGRLEKSTSLLRYHRIRHPHHTISHGIGFLLAIAFGLMIA